MVSPVSFTSTYKIKEPYHTSTPETLKRQHMLINECVENDFPYSENWKLDGKETTIVTPHALDGFFEGVCTKLNFFYEKISNKNLMDVQSIYNRVNEPPKDMVKAYIDLERLDALLKTQKDNNFEQCEKEYNEKYKSKADFALRSGDKISASTMYIAPMVGYGDYIKFMDVIGHKKLSRDAVFVGLIQRTEKPDHCQFFAMKNANMKKIPVYMDKNSYELAQALRIIAR